MKDGFYPMVVISLRQKAESMGQTSFVQSKMVKMEEGADLHSVSFIQEFIIKKKDYNKMITDMMGSTQFIGWEKGRIREIEMIS